MKRIFVTGTGFITSIGNRYSDVLESLLTQKTGIEPYGPFQDDKIPVKLTGTIKDFDVLSQDPEDWTFPAEYRPGRSLLRSLAPHGLYAYCAIEQALKQAGLKKEDISDPMTGLYTASAGSATNLHYYIDRLNKYGTERMGPMGVVSSIAGTLNFCMVSHYKIKGNSCGFVSACASSGHALGYAFEEIRSGRQDRMIVVGAEDGDSATLLPFAAMRAMSLEKDPTMAAKPFDVNRSGFIGTGGATVLILESEELAKQRDIEPLAEMLGWGQASDGHSPVLPEPDGKGLSRAMQNALDSAEVNAESVDYINAHATGTVSGDIAELRAIKEVFGPNATVKISGTKALTGHGLSLASAMEAGICVIALKEGICPGTAHLENPEPEIGNLQVIGSTEHSNPRIVLSNSSGFGGANVSILLKKFEST